MGKFKVGVFRHTGKSGRTLYTAYTTWYSPQWERCEEFDVVADNGTMAKRVAIACAKIQDRGIKPAPAKGGEP